NRVALALLALCCVAADWKTAGPGWQYEFPRDHHAHGDFKTEWWYFTGNLGDAAGRLFGFQLTFFRHGIRPPAQRDPEMSRFVVSDLKFAHFTVTDVGKKRFHFQQKASRGAFGEAGFDEGHRVAWIDGWNLRITREGAFHLQAEAKEAAIDLRLKSVKAPVIHGESGVSQKASSAGHASHYYSLTRLGSIGHLRLGTETFQVHGESWFDHEWATNQLAPGQIGWNWLSTQFDDGTELMLYQMRREDGTADPSSSGTFVANDGSRTHLESTSFRMTPTRYWKSGVSGATYPVGLRVEIPNRNLQFTVRAALENQELALQPLAYWEGAIEVDGVREGRAIEGRGYLELTGYAGPLRALQR
ncbi:MAG: lipocalin-like domain-containing protein, partial [Chthoniobacterales bacterium]